MKMNLKLQARNIRGPLFWFASGLLSGSLLSFFYDPIQGARRRALLSGKAVRSRHDLMKSTRRMARNLGNKTRGIFATYSHLHLSPAKVDDEILNQRVRSQLGHLIDHAHSIQTSARDGVITVSGPALNTIAREMIEFVRSIPGVQDVVDDLEVQREGFAMDDTRQPPGTLLQ